MNPPPEVPDEEALDACCGVCASLFHPTADHPTGPAVAGLLGVIDNEFPPGYDPAEADRLIGRDPKVQ